MGKKLEIGKTVIGSLKAKRNETGETKSYNIYYGNLVLPPVSGKKVIKLPYEQYRKFLNNFFKSSQGREYDYPSEDEIKADCERLIKEREYIAMKNLDAAKGRQLENKGSAEAVREEVASPTVAKQVQEEPHVQQQTRPVETQQENINHAQQTPRQSAPQVEPVNQPNANSAAYNNHAGQYAPPQQQSYTAPNVQNINTKQELKDVFKKEDDTPSTSSRVNSFLSNKRDNYQKKLEEERAEQERVTEEMRAQLQSGSEDYQELLAPKTSKVSKVLTILLIIYAILLTLAFAAIWIENDVLIRVINQYFKV